MTEEQTNQLEYAYTCALSCLVKGSGALRERVRKAYGHLAEVRESFCDIASANPVNERRLREFAAFIERGKLVDLMPEDELEDFAFQVWQACEEMNSYAHYGNGLAHGKVSGRRQVIIDLDNPG